MITTKELIKKTKEFATSENLSNGGESYSKNDPRLIAAALEVAQSSKSILGGLYYDFRKEDKGFFRKIKNKIIGKIANIVRNTLERPLLSQQKFNEQSFYLLELLLEENKNLVEEIKILKEKIKIKN